LFTERFIVHARGKGAIALILCEGEGDRVFEEEKREEEAIALSPSSNETGAMMGSSRTGAIALRQCRIRGFMRASFAAT